MYFVNWSDLKDDYETTVRRLSLINDVKNYATVLSVILEKNVLREPSSSHVLPKGRSFTANSGTKAAILPKGRSSIANSGTYVAVLLGMNRCVSFPLFSAPHSLFSIWTNLKRSEKIPGAPTRRVDVASWALRTSPKFTTGVKYQFHQGFWPDQRSGNPNHPSPPERTKKVHARS